MYLKHIGHAEFAIGLECGLTIVTDPYDESCGYPIQAVHADVALVSHGHHDHNAVHLLQGEPRVIDTEGDYTPEPGVRIQAISGFHDDAEGAKRGRTLLFLMEAEGLRVVHLGDLGCALTAEQEAVLHDPDILMIPVGGYFTIGAEQAKRIADRLGAKIILPMHYRTGWNKDWPIRGVEDFLQQYDAAEISTGIEMLRVTKGDISCQPHLVVFAHTNSVLKHSHQ